MTHLMPRFISSVRVALVLTLASLGVCACASAATAAASATSATSAAPTMVAAPGEDSALLAAEERTS